MGSYGIGVSTLSLPSGQPKTCNEEVLFTENHRNIFCFSLPCTSNRIPGWFCLRSRKQSQHYKRLTNKIKDPTFNAPKCSQFALLFTQHQTTPKVAAVPAAPLGVVAPFPGAQNLSCWRGATTTMHKNLCAMTGAATNRLCITAPFKHEWLGFLMLRVLRRCLNFFRHIASTLNH